MIGTWWLDLIWVLVATLLGFGISAVFSGWMRLSRRKFLGVYSIASSAFLYAFARWSEVDLGTMIKHNWTWGVIAGAIVATFLVFNVRTQPDSQKLTGGVLIFDIAWLGFVYGLIDALFLNVMPALATWEAFTQLGWTDTWAGTIAAGAFGLLASLLVTAGYHLGYPEFRSSSLGKVLLGNSLITLAYILPGNPLGAVISHVVMHIAAVNQGPETTIQLPPHYSRSVSSMQ